MLQQTTVATVIPRYARFLDRFPTLESLAAAEEAEVLAAWEGLGYYRRARSLHLAAKRMVEGGIPQTYDGWLALPGVGAYTAAAVCSISFGLPTPVVDANVERVYARLNADRVVGGALTRAAWKWAHDVVDRDATGDWNQATMELGALVCTPRSPQCPSCPVQKWCRAYAEGVVDQVPTPAPKVKKVDVLDQIWVVSDGDGRVAVRPIPPGRWWEGMWEFPREKADASGDRALEALFGDLDRVQREGVRHTVTHHRIVAQVFTATTSAPNDALSWVTWDDVASLPMPSPMRKAATIAQKANESLW